MRPFKEYDKNYLEKIIEECNGFRSVGRKLGVGGKTAKAIILRYDIKHHHFRHGKTYEDMIGKKYHMLKVLDVYRIKEKDKRVLYCARCLCDCGKQKDISVVAIKAKRTGSCGCDKSRYEKITGKNNKLFTGYEDIRGNFWYRLKLRAKRKNQDFTITIKESWELFVAQDKKCALSNVPIKFGRADHRTETTASLDRIDSNKGYIKDNVQWVHKSINIMKCDLSSDIFIGFCHSVSDKHINKVSIKELSCNHFTKRKYKRRTK